MRQAGSSGGLLGRLLAVVCLTLGVFGLGAVGASAATPASLVGEEFFSEGVAGNTISGTCPGPFTFSVSGTATGPYPGTFTESGSFTITNDDVISAFSARFTITSSAGRVTGSKSLLEGGATTCSGTSVFTFGDSHVNYTAVIDGAYRDTGISTVNVGSVPSPHLVEVFEHSNGVVPLQNDNGQGNNDNQGT